MRRSKFEQLVSQYLDGEISPSELRLLKSALVCNEERRQLFKQYSRLHAATCEAKLECLENLSCESGKHTYVSSLRGGWVVGGAFAVASCLSLAVFMGWHDRGSDNAAPPFAIAGGIEQAQIVEVDEVPTSIQLTESVVLLPEWNEDLVSLALMEQMVPLGEHEFPDVLDRVDRNRLMFVGQDYNPQQWQRPLRPLDRHRNYLKEAGPQNVRLISGSR